MPLPQPQDPPQTAPPDLAKTVAAIGFAAHILGLFCIYDTLREGLGAYQYHTAIPVLAIYKAVLGIYAAARQGHQSMCLRLMISTRPQRAVASSLELHKELCCSSGATALPA
jgi:hypothetical protein